MLAPCVGVVNGCFSAHRSSEVSRGYGGSVRVEKLQQSTALDCTSTLVGLYTHILTKGTKKMFRLVALLEEHIKFVPQLMKNCNIYPFSHPNGEGGSPFDAGRCPVGVQRLVILSGLYISGIQVLFRDGNESPMFGTSWIDGSRHEFNVAEGDFIVKVEVWSGGGTDAVRFTTNCGFVSPKFGGDGGKLRVHRARAGHQLVGICGRCGGLIDKLDVKWGPV